MKQPYSLAAVGAFLASSIGLPGELVALLAALPERCVLVPISRGGCDLYQGLPGYSVQSLPPLAVSHLPFSSDLPVAPITHRHHLTFVQCDGHGLYTSSGFAGAGRRVVASSAVVVNRSTPGTPISDPPSVVVYTILESFQGGALRTSSDGQAS